jgi:hypothetical protein
MAGIEACRFSAGCQLRTNVPANSYSRALTIVTVGVLGVCKTGHAFFLFAAAVFLLFYIYFKFFI